MEIDPLDMVTQPTDIAVVKKAAWLNPAVAITVALLATFMGICKVKDDNIVQAMQQAQADKLDHWQFYQARNIREEIAKSTLVQLKLQAATAPTSLRGAYEEPIRNYEALMQDQIEKKSALKVAADKDQSTYDALNFRDDQFDLSDASIAIAISLLAVTSLTQMPWLFILAMVPSSFGILMGLAGLLGWTIHPNSLVQMLS